MNELEEESLPGLLEGAAPGAKVRMLRAGTSKEHPASVLNTDPLC